MRNGDFSMLQQKVAWAVGPCALDEEGPPWRRRLIFAVVVVGGVVPYRLALAFIHMMCVLLVFTILDESTSVRVPMNETLSEKRETKEAKKRTQKNGGHLRLTYELVQY